MIIAKNNPVGLDAVIARIQKAIDDAFKNKWKREDQEENLGIICYPRCYINIKNKHKHIEYFDSMDDKQSIDYLDVLDTETNKLIILNDDYEIVKIGPNHYSTYLDLIFLVDLNSTHKSIKHRADEEVRLEVTKEIEKVPNISIYNYTRKLNKIFGDIKYDYKLNLQPSHCFKITVHVDRFTQNEKYCGVFGKVVNNLKK